MAVAYLTFPRALHLSSSPRLRPVLILCYARRLREWRPIQNGNISKGRTLCPYIEDILCFCQCYIFRLCFGWHPVVNIIFGRSYPLILNAPRACIYVFLNAYTCLPRLTTHSHTQTRCLFSYFRNSICMHTLTIMLSCQANVYQQLIQLTKEEVSCSQRPC